jgi:hypothetical protein
MHISNQVYYNRGAKMMTERAPEEQATVKKIEVPRDLTNEKIEVPQWLSKEKENEEP